MVSIFKIDSPLVVASPAVLDFTSPQGPEFASILNGAMDSVQNPEITGNAEQPEQLVLVMPEEQSLNLENALIEEEVSEEINLSDTKPEDKEETEKNPEIDLFEMNYPVYFRLTGLAVNASGFENPGVSQDENSSEVISRGYEISLNESSGISRQVNLSWTETEAADTGDYGQPTLEVSGDSPEISPETVQAEAGTELPKAEFDLKDAVKNLESGLQPEVVPDEKSETSGLHLSETPENSQYSAGTKPFGKIDGRSPDAKPVEFKIHTRSAESQEGAEFTVFKTGQDETFRIQEFNQDGFEFQPFSLKADDEIKASRKPEGIGTDKLAGLQFSRFNVPAAVSVEKSGGSNLSAPADVPVYEQVFDGVKVNLDLGKNSFSIKLNPEGLGELQVKMTMDEGKVILELNTSLASTRDLISGQINELKSALASSSIQVTDFTINCTGETNPGILSFDSFGSGFGRDTGRQAYYEEQPEYYSDYSEYREKSPRAVFVPGRLNYKI